MCSAARSAFERAMRPLLAAVLLAVLLASCGDSSVGSTASGSADDVEFASAMTQHHAQTLQLLNMPQTLRMPTVAVSWVDATRTDLFKEIEDLSQMLKARGAKVPETGLSHASEGRHIEFDSSISGILPEKDMTKLLGLRGDEFSKAWFAALLLHERGALSLAQAEAADGEDPALVRFADNDVERHRALVASLQERLGG